MTKVWLLIYDKGDDSYETEDVFATKELAEARIKTYPRWRQAYFSINEAEVITE